MSLLALVLSGCGSAGASKGTDDPAPAPPTGGPAATAPPERTRGTVASGEVAYVTDGDTIAVQIEGTLTRIRLIGIDAPESKHPTEPVECYGKEAGVIADRLLPQGIEVTVVTDPTQDREDRYGRLLAYVLVPGRRGTVNEALVRRGAAVVYVYRRSRPPRRLAALVAAQDDARSAQRGLWRQCPDPTEG